MNQPTLLQKINVMERDLIRLKAEAFSRSTTSRKKRALQFAEPSVLRELGKVRDMIWRERYAKNIEGLS